MGISETTFLSSAIHQACDHKHQYSPHCPYLSRGVVLTGFQGKLETSTLLSFMEQISISDTGTTDLALQQGNALKAHLKFFPASLF